MMSACLLTLESPSETNLGLVFLQFLTGLEIATDTVANATNISP